MWTYERVYVIQCYDNTFYVGSTLREMHDRWEEHREGHGSRWTAHHGAKRVLCCKLVEKGTSGTLEDELTEWLMHQYGVHNVGGGNYVNCRPDCYASDWWLPKSLQGRSRAPDFSESTLTDVPALHFSAVSKFPLELGRLIDTFKVFRGLKHPNHLNPKPLAYAVLGGGPKQNEHVLPAQLVPPALGAKQVPVISVRPDHGQEYIQRVRDGIGEANVNRAN